MSRAASKGRTEPRAARRPESRAAVPAGTARLGAGLSTAALLLAVVGVIVRLLMPETLRASVITSYGPDYVPRPPGP